VRGRAVPAGGQLDARSAAKSSLTVTVRLPADSCCRAASGARAASGPALRVGLPPDDLGPWSHRLRWAAEVVLKPAGFRRFPASLWVITGILSAWLEFPVAANSDHAPAAAATSTRCLTWPDRTRPARFRDHPVPVITEDPRVITGPDYRDHQKTLITDDPGAAPGRPVIRDNAPGHDRGTWRGWLMPSPDPPRTADAVSRSARVADAVSRSGPGG
jgi:hypothetical protein